MARNEFEKMTPEQRRENGRKGGIASGEAKRQKRAMRETIEILLSMPMKPGKSVDIEAAKNYASLKGKNISVQEALIISMVQKAMKGDVRAAEWVRDTAGQNARIQAQDNGDADTTAPIIINDTRR